ncbi:MAG: glycoside hydrolase family 3 protein [Acidobacteria bacterium]|nr:glycoside hydrolase family 3 protein [Acidobacteriota bacterium]
MTSNDALHLVNGLIMPGFIGTTAPPWLLDALADGLGGVTYFSHNIDAAVPGQLAALSAQIRAANPTAIIALDEEGGNVTRLESAAGSSVPGAAVLGKLDDATLTEKAGRALGSLCRAAGVTLNLAPVADVNTNPDNPVIGVRSFGAETTLVARHTAAMVRGIQSQGVGACVKHFPGHGDTVTDSHTSLPRVDYPRSVLEDVHLPPFTAAVGAGVQAVMTAHIIVPALHAEDSSPLETPATLDPTAGALLRSSGFDGVLVTDALDMAAIRETVGMGPGAVAAVLAGADLLCVGNPANIGYADESVGSDQTDFHEVRNALLAAVEEGILPEERLREGARRRAAFTAWAISVQPVAESQELSDIDWVAVALRATTVSFALNATVAQVELPASVRHILLVDGRAGHNNAAGRTADFLAAALREARPTLQVESLPVASLDATHPAATRASSEAACVVVVDALNPGSAGARAAETVLGIFPDALAVNVGVSEPENPPLPCINSFGYSRASAAAVAQVLLEERLGVPRTLSSKPDATEPS